MKFDFSKVTDFDQATEDNRYYRDFDDIDMNQNFNLYELAQIIRQHGKGTVVREAIAKGLELIEAVSG